MSAMFDRFAKMAAGGVSRRDALKYLGGFLTGGFLAGLAGRARADDDGGDDDDNGDENEEVCKKYCRGCPKSPASTFGKCMSACKKCLHKKPKGKPCGACSALTPFTCCPGRSTCCTPAGAIAYCANFGTDVNNCGACGKVCKSATGALLACCAGKCVDTTSDVNNCGKCGKVCPVSPTGAKPTCTAGVCG